MLLGKLMKPLFLMFTISFALAAICTTASAEAEVVVVVSSASPVVSLKKSDVANIFLGKTRRFPNGERAVPINQLEGSAERNEFYDMYTGKSAPQLKAHWSKMIFTGRGQPPKEVGSLEELKAALAKNNEIVTYVEAGMVGDGMKVVAVK